MPVRAERLHDRRLHFIHANFKLSVEVMSHSVLQEEQLNYLNLIFVLFDESNGKGAAGMV
jgi:hypothetical protein